MSNTINITITDDNGDECVIGAPAHYQICSECAGHGKHSHAVDGNGITSSEWNEWDQDDREAYMGGAYDVQCETCNGQRVEHVINWDAFEASQPEEFKAVEAHYREEEAYRAEEAAERRMGC